MNFKGMIDRSLRMMGLDPNRPVYIARDEVGGYVNEAYREFVRETGVLETMWIVRAVAGQSLYELPPVIMRPYAIWYDDMKVMGKARAEIVEEYGDLENETGAAPLYWSMDREFERRFTVYPAPQYSGKDFVPAVQSDGLITRFNDTDGDYTFTDTKPAEGIIVQLSGSFQTVAPDARDGIMRVLGMSKGNFQIWGVREPLELSLWDDETELPGYLDIALCYRAAALGLLADKETRNPELAEVYNQMVAEAKVLTSTRRSLRNPADSRRSVQEGPDIRRPFKIPAPT